MDPLVTRLVAWWRSLHVMTPWAVIAEAPSPGEPPPCAVCHYGGPHGGHPGGHVHCSCGTTSPHLTWRERRAWRREHRTFWAIARHLTPNPTRSTP